jgi:NADH pyrophosphatase NudC (nudix superfamily)
MEKLNMFCSFCGKKLQKEEEHYKCSNCKKLKFKNPLPCVSILFIKKDKLLLARRGIDPFKGYLDSIGGFVEITESFEEAAIRESQEEINFKPTNLEYLCSFPDIYLYQGIQYNILSVTFISYTDSYIKTTPGDDVASVEWHNISNIDLNEIAFESIKKSINLLIK